ncbi:MAG TPA: GNAT family N-acetyltransferase [Gemmataceae bacterium]|nr:GNAT family N-acetyltransferase [Gemmataceae bacterium]
MNGPALHTERLFLRPFREDDLDDLAALYADVEVMQFLGEGRPLAHVQTKERLERMLRHWQEHRFGIWALFAQASGDFVGRCGVAYLHRPGQPELAYTLARRYWNQGLASEAVARTVRHAFEVLGLPRVVAFARVENVASQKVMTKIGMAFQEQSQYGGLDAVMYVVENAAKRTSGT